MLAGLSASKANEALLYIRSQMALVDIQVDSLASTLISLSHEQDLKFNLNASLVYKFEL